ncbi:DASH complex, subunit Spc34 [Ascodesmis nigricans]|uniref:DASH complex subunit SPC34 n=1 Tax=Ascodesmis nigricans TaxID=341454 RepID=A0A4S2N1E7_9PEZI|nr:DASH complex, subunit Spc34 [Ascodesmis nigricans]
MLSSLAPHLERINSSLDEIETYPFPESRIFTNALLKSNDIVTFIRDTEAHERALFVPVAAKHDATPHAPKVEVASGHRNPTVYSVLGGDMVGRIRKGFAGQSKEKGEVPDIDVDLLLLGAEKLSSVYQIPQAASRIAHARQRYEDLSESIANYEALVASQQTQLSLIKRLGEEEAAPQEVEDDDSLDVTDAMIEEQETLIRELEERKEMLERKVKQIDENMNSVYRGFS